MKTSNDPRHLARIKTMQEIFAWTFKSDNHPEDTRARQIIKKLSQIDSLIQNSAPSWPIEKINKVDLAILRLATFELTIDKKNPPKVVVDEAVELAKNFGGETSPSFVNGALGKLIQDQKIPT